MYRLIVLSFVAAGLCLPSSQLSAKPKPSAKKKRLVGELERLGPGGSDFLVVGLDAPGFVKLPAQKKILAYYLYRAAIAGNDILYLQNHRDALTIKRLLEAIYLKRHGIPQRILSGLHDYLKYVWVNHGQYDHRSNVKFVPRALTFDQLLLAAKRAAKNGARFDFLPGRSLEDRLGRLRRSIFDAKYESQLSVTRKGVDIIKSSAVNLFDAGITGAMLKTVPKALYNKLNVRFALKDGKVVAQPFRVGGVYDQQLRRVVHFLKLAVPYAESASQRKGLESLIAHLTGGDEERFRQYSVHWLKSDTEVDYLAGFIEQLKDPRGIIGSWEGAVSYKSDSRLIERIADNALYFEQRMPWLAKYRRKQVKKPVSNVVDVLIGTGDMGPVPWAGYNLPNYADIRKNVGSKNMVLLNIMQSGSEKSRKRLISAFYLPQYRAHQLKYGKLLRRMVVYLHEVIGHGSGQPDPALKTDPRVTIGRSFSALEECRADLVALYHIGDPKLPAVGAFRKADQQAIVRAMYIYFLVDHMVGLRRVDGDVVKEAHRKAGETIFNFLLKGGLSGKEDYGVRLVKKSGDYTIELQDAKRVRKGIAALLSQIQVIKSSGDRKGADALFDRFGTHYNKELRKNMIARSRKLGLAKQRAVVYPRLQPKVRGGKVVDVAIFFDQTLTSQQLLFSAIGQQTTLLSHPDELRMERP